MRMAQSLFLCEHLNTRFQNSSQRETGYTSFTNLFQNALDRNASLYTSNKQTCIHLFQIQLHINKSTNQQIQERKRDGHT